MSTGRLRRVVVRAPLVVAERLAVARLERPHHPPLFILGLPRTGTTLVYQYVVHRLRVAYFTNGVGDHPYAPVATTWLQARVHPEYRSDFASEYGKVVGPMAPREAGAFWLRFFPRDDYVDAGVPLARRRALEATVAGVERVFAGVSFVNKNVRHQQWLLALAAVFPRAAFLVVERPAADVAISVLRARLRQPDPRAWWSVRPDCHERLGGLPLAVQVAGQVLALRDRLDRDLSRLDARRVVRISYAAFCARPEELIARIAPLVTTGGDRNPPVHAFPAVAHAPATDDEARAAELAELGSLPAFWAAVGRE